MPLLLEYILKFSVSLAVLYIFYQLILRPLTFYQWNRFYLLGYSLLSFVLPFINITPWIKKQGMADIQLVNRIPVIGNYSFLTNGLTNAMNLSDWLLILFISGTILMLGRLLIQYFSLKRIRNNSVLLDKKDDISLFATDALISPFSFGKSIYVNRELHSDDELQRIVQHEIVHVKQQHTIDLLLGELLCVFNWFNPFAWLIRNAIRQNLEFIADNNVLAKGHDKKEYQYLLLKVVGVPQYSVANNFNMPNLKKRIAMMNKIKSARLHLTRFLFALPLLAFILLAFRSEHKDAFERKITLSGPVIILKEDTVPRKDSLLIGTTDSENNSRNSENLIGMTVSPENNSPKPVNKKGYILTIADNSGECIVLIRDKKENILKAMTLVDWDRNKEKNEKMYGPIPPAPRKQATSLQGSGSTIKGSSGSAMSISSESGVFISKPLYIVDGREQNSEFKVSTIQPADIESVSVWKGINATIKYGEKGENGVIEIQTKTKPKSPASNK